MQADLIATPLPDRFFDCPHKLFGDFEIRELPPVLWDQSVIARRFFTVDDVEKMSRTTFWLTMRVSPSAPPSDELYRRLRTAMDALQIFQPIGCMNLFLALSRTEEGLDHVGSVQDQTRECTFLNGRLHFETDSMVNFFEKTYRGIAAAFDAGEVRLQNPIIVLELALQARNIHIALLTSVMGLDMLMMAASSKPFVDRLQKFLGADTYVFPPLAYTRQQPKLSVRDIAKDLYDLRSTIAHGQSVPERFRVDHELQATDGEPTYITLNYTQLLMETGIALLAQCLRKIFVEDLSSAVSDTSKWRKVLEGSHPTPPEPANPT